SLAPAPGPTGLPQVEVVPAAPTPAQRRPNPPVLEAPRFEGHATLTGGSIPVSGLGGVLGGAVVVIDGFFLRTVLPVSPLGIFGGPVSVLGPGTRNLLLFQSLRPDGLCVAPGDCSTGVGWKVTIDSATPGLVPAPHITAPRDLTHSPEAANNVFEVAGTGIDAPVKVCDEGTAGPGGVLATNITTTPDGVITGTITLLAGSTATPLDGWHKLRFTQAADCLSALPDEKSPPVFVSV